MGKGSPDQKAKRPAEPKWLSYTETREKRDVEGRERFRGRSEECWEEPQVPETSPRFEIKRLGHTYCYKVLKYLI